MKTRFVQYQNVETEIALSDDLAAVLDEVASAKRGRFAFVSEHHSGVNDPKCVRPTVSDKWFISNPSYPKYLQRKGAAILALADEVQVFQLISVRDAGKLQNKLAEENAKATAKKKTAVTMSVLFQEAKKALLESIAATQTGDRTDGYRIGHDACYAKFTSGDVGVSLHLKTENDGEGHKRPVFGFMGLMEADSVMLPYFLITRRMVDAGEWLPTDSKALTLMKRAIEEASGVPEWTNLSLGVGNFKHITLNSAEIRGKLGEMVKSAAETAFIALLRDICALNGSILETLDQEAQMGVLEVVRK